MTSAGVLTVRSRCFLGSDAVRLGTSPFESGTGIYTMTMPHLENCPHSPIGHCLKCHSDFVESGLPMPDEDNRPDYWRCICGRSMSKIFAVDDGVDGGIALYWCAGCGVVHVHYADGTGDSRYIPNPKFVGKEGPRLSCDSENGPDVVPSARVENTAAGSHTRAT